MMEKGEGEGGKVQCATCRAREWSAYTSPLFRALTRGYTCSGHAHADTSSRRSLQGRREDLFPEERVTKQ